MKLWFSALLAAALLSACAKPPAGQDPPRIAESRWNMTHASFGVPAGVTPTLEFRAGRVLAHSGCNRGSGAYQDRDGTLAIDALMSTRMACRDDINRFEITYYRLLGAHPAYRIEADALTLTAGDDNARFTRARESLGRTVEIAPTRVDCVGVTKMSCLQWRERPDEPWRRHYGEIAGFTHRTGTTYVLRVREETVTKPPADAPSVRWVLERVLQERTD